MFTFTKEEALFAAEQFCYGLQVWTGGFTNDYITGCLDYKTNEEGQYLYEQDVKNRLISSRFVTNINIIYDFAENGSWNGKALFEDTDKLENELCEPLTELTTFQEVFSHEQNNFHDVSGADDLLDVRVAGQDIISILKQIIGAAFARFSLVTDGSLTPDELALLAGVSLKTVRNAMSAKGSDRLVTGNGIDGKTIIDSQEAMRWLLTKKGFTGPYLLSYMPYYETYQTLGQFQHHCMALMTQSNIEWAEVQSTLSWADDEKQAFMQMTKLKISDQLSLITPMLIKQFGELLKQEPLERFVTEGSKILASTLAELQASKLFFQKK